MRPVRSDLAIEICNSIFEHTPKPDGIECKESFCGSMPIEQVRILNQKGEELSGKPCGTYLTLNTGKIWLDDREIFREKVLHFAELFTQLLKQKTKVAGSVLVAGLGNQNITADAIGPVAVKHLVVTRHIRKERPLIFEDLGLSDVCAITPGVLGQTGIESADVIRSVVKSIEPELVIAIDALASRDPGRLVTTIQLCDTGIRPGSGVGNQRPALTQEELGVPVIAVGVPTVVDAATLAADAIRRFSGKREDAENVRKEWSKSDLNFFVTPKETDQIIRVMGSFIGYGITLALNRDLSYEDMLSLVG